MNKKSKESSNKNSDDLDSLINLTNSEEKGSHAGSSVDLNELEEFLLSRLNTKGNSRKKYDKFFKIVGDLKSGEFILKEIVFEEFNKNKGKELYFSNYPRARAYVRKILVAHRKHLAAVLKLLENYDEAGELVHTLEADND